MKIYLNGAIQVLLSCLLLAVLFIKSNEWHQLVASNLGSQVYMVPILSPIEKWIAGCRLLSIILVASSFLFVKKHPGVFSKSVCGFVLISAACIGWFSPV